MIRKALAIALRPVIRLAGWIGRHEVTVLLAVLSVVLASWVFIELADEVIEGSTQALDERVLRAMRRPDDPAVPIGPRWMHEVGRDLTAVGGIAVLTILTGAVAGFLLLRRMYGAMLLVLVATVGGVLVASLFKMTFARERPSVVEHLSIVTSSSFPSGHSLISAVVYLTLGTLLGRFVKEWTLKAYFFCVALLLTCLVGISRVYMGVHYPTDVLAGWAAGLAWALLCWLGAKYLQNRGAVEKARSIDE
jgi:undecaprenyl-diphosphatase